MTKIEILSNLKNYCLKQERCYVYLSTQLKKLGVDTELQKEIIAELSGQDLINEKRFAQSYVDNKIRTKKWGRQRIIKELQFLNIPREFIKNAIQNIDHEQYIQNLNRILSAKIAHYASTNDAFETRKKTAIYALKQGYEQSLIWVVINELK